MGREDPKKIHKKIPHVSVVLPCFNDGKILPDSIKKIAYFLDSLNREYEIIVSDDGSTDMTPSLDWSSYQELWSVTYLRSNKNLGKGAALRRGLSACCGKFIFFTDSDIPVDLEAIASCLSLLENNDADLVIGDRRLSGSKAAKSAPKSRFIASKLFNIGVQLIALPGYTDTQCCMKGFTQEALKQLLPASFLTSYAFDVELLYLAKLRGMRIKRISVLWKDVRADIPLTKLTYIVVSCLKDVVLVRLKN